MTAGADRAARPPVLPSGWTLAAFDRVGSTNDEAKRMAAAGAADRTMVWARRQDAGRARRGRQWLSPEGNLFCTAILRPDCAAAVAGQITFVVALALDDALARLAPGLDTRLKWPNDVLVGGRKVSGILLEATTGADGRVDWVVAGLGVNVVGHPEGMQPPATSLAAAGAAGASAEDLLRAYAAALSVWLDRWRGHGFSGIRDAWLGRAGGLGAAIRVRLDRQTLTGTFEDLDRDGALLLRTADGVRRITAGDVFFAEPAAAAVEGA